MRVYLLTSNMMQEVTAAETFLAERPAEHTAFHGADVECNAATTLQSIWRGRAARLALQQRIQAIIKLQVSWLASHVSYCSYTYSVSLCYSFFHVKDRRHVMMGSCQRQAREKPIPSALSETQSLHAAPCGAWLQC